jgi:D-ribose pyranase
MLKQGLLNPAVVELLARFRHTNTIVLADRGFPFWKEVPTIDLSLVDDIPTVRQVLRAIVPAYVLGGVWMAEEFLLHNQAGVQEEYQKIVEPQRLQFLSHAEFKKRVPAAVGLIRTGDTTPYGNIILESA